MNQSEVQGVGEVDLKVMLEDKNLKILKKNFEQLQEDTELLVQFSERKKKELKKAEGGEDQDAEDEEKADQEEAGEDPDEGEEEDEYESVEDYLNNILVSLEEFNENVEKMKMLKNVRTGKYFLASSATSMANDP